MDAESNNPERILIHDDQDPVGPQRSRLAPEEINTPEAVFQVAQESQPGRTIGVLSRLVVTGENPANHVFVDLEMERQGHLLSDSRTAPVGITLLHFDDRTDEFCARTLRAGLPAAIRGEQHPVLSFAHGFMNGSERLRNGADELDAPRAPSSQRGSGPTPVEPLPQVA